MHKPRIQLIIQWLEEEGPLSTREVYDLWLDRYPKKAPTMYELGNMLSRNKMIEKESHSPNEKTKGFTNKMYGSKYIGHAVWKVKKH